MNRHRRATFVHRIGPTESLHLGMGAAVLSAGGGSFPYLEYLGLRELLAETPAVPMVGAPDLADDARVALVAMVGAPLPMFERFVDAAHFARPVEVLARHLGAEFDYVMGYEIGSMNALIPVMVAARTGLPLVDADTLGRSFPQVDMSGFAIAGVKMTPIAVSDVRENDLIITRAVDGKWTEALLRPIATACGSIIAIAGSHSGKDVKQHAHLGTYSRAMRIGRAITEAQRQHIDPVAALLSDERGNALHTGKVVDVERRILDGFVRGRALIESEAGVSATLYFQNEYSVVERAGHKLAMVPDLIAVFDTERGEPLGTEALRYAQRVTILRLPPLPRHLTPQALSVLGPRAFGFNFDYEFLSDEAPQ